MTALAQAFSRFSANTNLEADTLKILAMFSGAGLVVSLICASHGIDLGSELF